MDKLIVGNVWTTLDNANSPVWKGIDALESVLDGGLGLKHVAGNKFLSGLYSAAYAEYGTPFEWASSAPGTLGSIPSFVDRAFQYDAVQAARVNRRGVIKVPTGGGKTRIAAGIMGSLTCTWLYVTSKDSLVRAAAEEFRKLLNEPVTEVYSNTLVLGTARIVCATFDALNSARAMKSKVDLITSSQGIIVDECHKSPTKTAMGVLVSAENAYYRIGLSATPFMREDQRDIITVGLLGPEIYSIEPQTLIEQGFLVPPNVEWLDVEQSLRAGVDQNDWHDVYTNLIVTSNTRNNKLVEEIIFCEKPAIVFVKEKLHGKILFDHLQTALDRFGVEDRVQYLNGDNSVDDRKAAIKKVRAGDLDILVCTNIFSEGLDLPMLKSVFNCTGESSWKEALQRLGRGTRPSKDKDTFTIYDVNDVGNRWLEEHTTQRYLAYTAAGFKVDAPNHKAAYRAAGEAVRANPTMRQPWFTEEQKGGLWLLAILGPIVAFVFGLLWRLGRK